MKCEKCQDRGFTEENHGLLIILCDCDKAREVALIANVPWREDDSVSGTGRDNQPAGSADTGQSKKRQKPKAKKKARARAG